MRLKLLVAVMICFLALCCAGGMARDPIVLGDVARGDSSSVREAQLGQSALPQIMEEGWANPSGTWEVITETTETVEEAHAVQAWELQTWQVNEIVEMTHGCTSCQQQSGYNAGCGSWQPTPTPTVSTMTVCLASVQRNGMGADGMQLYYDVGLVNVLMETAFSAVFGQTLTNIPTAYEKDPTMQHIAFAPPAVIHSISNAGLDMQGLASRGIAATACAERNGQTIAIAVAGSGPTVSKDNQILDTQWVIVVDTQGHQEDLFFTRVGAEFWQIDIRC